MKKLTPIAAIDRLSKWRKCSLPMDEHLEALDVLYEEIGNFDKLKENIASRKKDYKKELDSGVDGDGIPLTKTERIITMNLYNLCIALEGIYKDD